MSASQKSSRWGSFLSQAVAGVEARLDNILAEDDATKGSTTPAAVPNPSPAPPAENPPHPHRYTNLLWEQPANWQIPSAANTMLQNQKLGFNVANFITAAGLSNPIAANYFNVTG
ncbi:hypothetical protein O1611_g2148 [Lasiodiplodia mahajangana]|uniref:Uncharacterized protein n=1 Tax=Lasiodiplodia mahajangana TaxID=1108764 RepID=A0ACC2JVN7_9PEZI|nr:hypothetical protein O1611_g2148 [Lasiodiplodia mahajangana]